MPQQHIIGYFVRYLTTAKENVRKLLFGQIRITRAITWPKTNSW